MNFNITVEIQASPQTVWGVLREIKRWPEWTPTVTSIQRLDNGPLVVGSRARIRQPKLPPADWAEFHLGDRGPGRSCDRPALGRSACERKPGHSVAHLRRARRARDVRLAGSDTGRGLMRRPTDVPACDRAQRRLTSDCT